MWVRCEQCDGEYNTQFDKYCPTCGPRWAFEHEQDIELAKDDEGRTFNDKDILRLENALYNMEGNLFRRLTNSLEGFIDDSINRYDRETHTKLLTAARLIDVSTATNEKILEGIPALQMLPYAYNKLIQSMEQLEKLTNENKNLTKQLSATREELSDLKKHVASLPTAWQMVLIVVVTVVGAFLALRYGLPHAGG